MTVMPNIVLVHGAWADGSFPSSHIAMVSHPDEVTRFIETAAPEAPATIK